MNTTDETSGRTSRVPRTARFRSGALKRWPTGIGLLAATVATVVIFALGADVEFGPGIATMMGVYPAAWAIGRPAAAWPAFGVLAVILVSVSLTNLNASYIMTSILGVLWLWVVLRGLSRHRRWFTIETAGLVFFGAVTIAAAVVEPRVGGVLAGVGFLTHGLWDAFHFVKNRVVNRPWSEMCAVLDIPVGLILIVVTLVR